MSTWPRQSVWIAAAALLLALSTFPCISETPGSASEDWSAAIRQQIAAEEYHVTWQKQTNLPDLDSAWHAPNRTHNLRTYFTPAGVRVVRRTVSEPSWEWSLSLVRVGRPGALQEVGQANPSVFRNRIDYERQGAYELHEWYVNDERGVEQRFTVPLAPGAEGNLVYIDIAVGGTLHGILAEDRQSFDFQTTDGRRLIHYGHLKVTDATGRTLRSWMEGFADETAQGIRLVVEDAGASYPLDVDPMFSSPSWTVSPGNAGEKFGFSVAAAGDVNGDGYGDVVVGAPEWDFGTDGSGRVFIYHGTPSGLGAAWAWASDSSISGGQLGFSVATAGDLDGDGFSDVLAGRPTLNVAATLGGGFHVYYGSEGGVDAIGNWYGWMENGRLGYAVSTAGDINGDRLSDIIIGMPGAGVAAVYAGAVDRNLTVTRLLSRPPGPNPAYNFGRAVGFAGDVNRDNFSDVIVGDPGNHKVYVWYGSFSGPGEFHNWSHTESGSFGYSVGTAGDVNGDGYSDIIAGAPNHSGSKSAEGRAYLFLGGSPAPELTASWEKGGSIHNESFGQSVGTAGDANGDGYADVIIGSSNYSAGETAEGGAFVYLGSPSGLSEDPAWSAESDQAFARFGSSVATAGDVNGDGYSDLVVGAPDYGESAYQGRAYVYHGSPSSLGSSIWSSESNQADAGLGSAVSTAGDVNGDGYDDVIVGVPGYDGGQANEGRAYVYYGSASGVEPDWSFYRESQQVNALFGKSVSTAGDINSDGFSDIIVGAPGYTNGQAKEGRAYVYLGSATGLSYHWKAESNVEYAYFGDAVGWAGDVNGDGYGDIIVGAPSYDAPTNAEGGAFVWYGWVSGLGDDGIPANADWHAESNQEFANLGSSVATAGDVNGDGYSDVLVGAIYYNNGHSAEGAAFAWHGSPMGLGAAGNPSNADWAVDGNQQDAHLGRSVSTAGDVNRDGYADVIVGASGWDDDTSTLENVGRADLYTGSSSGLLTSPTDSLYGTQEGEWLGFSVAGVGDVNGDGHADVAIGRPYWNDASGAVSVRLGSAYAFSGVWTTGGGQAGARFGYSVAPAGDIDSDGYADLIVGAPGHDKGEINEGRAYVFPGNKGRARPVHPVQRSPWGPRIDRLAYSWDSAAFDLELTAYPFNGMGTVRIETEVKKLGEALDGTGIWKDAWFNGHGGFTLTRHLTGVEPNFVYHWRIRTGQHPWSSPYQLWSRWITRPWGGIEEGRLRLWSNYDSDLLDDRQDNCPWITNPDQEDADGDGAGDVCDNCPADPNPEQENNDGDSQGDVCDLDDDDDGVADDADNCPLDSNTGQENHDGDSMGDTCDPDDDDDGWDDVEDCRTLDESVWSAPSRPVALNLSKAEADNLSWSAPTSPGSGSVFYDVLRSASPQDWSAGTAFCLESGGTDQVATANANPPPGLRYCYLIRSANPCGENMGHDSLANPRSGVTCP